MSRLGIVMLVGATILASTAGSASAKTPFDGRWSVVIITDRGSCDRAYRYSIEIQNGIVRYTGDVVEMGGRVANNGAVRVTVARGNQRAVGQGRMGRDYGGGTWTGLGNGDTCSGNWEAERR